MASVAMPLEIATDVGGTFTDLVLREANGLAHFFKSLTTPGELSEGIFNGLDLMAKRFGLTVHGLLSNCQSFACGTTAATNAILEQKTAKTLLFCTEGFRDTLAIREGGRPNGFSITEKYPEPYIPRALTFGVRERVNAEGGIEIPLDLVQAESLLRQAASHEPEAIAVAFLWSMNNPAHELAFGELIERLLPHVSYSLSHRVNPVVGEYRRTSATAIDASLKPVLRLQIGNLESRLRAAGLPGFPTFVCSNGGRTSSADIVNKPVYLCLSGPSTAPQAAARLAAAAGVDCKNIITIDLGGTSLDASISPGGKVAMHREGAIAGHVFGVPSVDVVTVGAGGGSIAWVDEGGLIHVGPESAGSVPGPACYGRGGSHATLTDANLVRGLLNADRFADGQFKLSKEASIEAVRKHVAQPLGISVEKAANLIALVAEQNMVAAIEDLAMRRGYDPREFAIVSGGAAGGLHAAALAAHLGVKHLLVPKASSVLCAYGTATGDIKFDFSRSFFAQSTQVERHKINIVLSDLEQEGLAFLDRMNISSERRQLHFSVDARYQGQVSQLTVSMPKSRLESLDDLAVLIEAFHSTHKRIYSVCAPGDAVEFVSWGVEAIGLATELSCGIDAPPAEVRRVMASKSRPAFVDSTGTASEVSVFEADDLREGDQLPQRSLVEGALTTVFVPDGCTATVTREGGLLMTVLNPAMSML